MKRTALMNTSSAKRTSKDRPNGSRYRPSSKQSKATKYTVNVVNPEPPVTTISCAGATTVAYMAILAKPPVDDGDEIPEIPEERNLTVLMEINGREYDVSMGPNYFPSELHTAVMESVDLAQRPLGAPSEYEYVILYKIDNLSVDEAKRIKITSFNADGSDPDLMIAFSPTGNPTASSITKSLEGNKFVSTVCLSRNTSGGGGGVDPEPEPEPEPEPTEAFAPDFAFRMMSVSTSAVADDGSGNAFSGLVRDLSIAGLETRFMAKLDNSNPIEILEIDGGLGTLDITFDTQVLAGDYFNISVYREDKSPQTQAYYWQKVNTAQAPITGAECEVGFAQVDLGFISGGGYMEYQPNTRYKFEAQVMRGTVGSSSNSVVGEGVSELIEKVAYSTAQNYPIYDGTNLILSLRYASSYIAADYKTYRIGVNPSNVNLLHSLGSPDSTNVGSYGTLHPNTNKMWSYLSNTTASSMTWKAYDSVRGVQMDLVFATAYELYKKDPVLIFSNDSRYAVMCYVAGGNGNTSALYTAPLVFDDTTLQYRALNEGETFDLSYAPMYPDVGTFSNGRVYNNPGFFSGAWSTDGNVFLKVLPIDGFNVSSTENNKQYLPTLYEVSARQASGSHDLVISPSNESLLNLLRRIGILDRTDYGTDKVHYSYEIFNTGKYLYVYPVIGNGFTTFLLERNADVWTLHSAFVTSELSHLPDTLPSHDNAKIVHLNNIQYVNNSIKRVMLGDDEMLIIDAGVSKVPFVNVIGGTVLELLSYNLATKSLNAMSIGE